MVREGIRHVLSSGEGFDVVGEAAHGGEAVKLAQTLQPDVVVIDLAMPQLSGLKATARIREAVPRARILVLSMHEHEEYVQQSIRAGASGYLRKDSTPAELREAVRAVWRGESHFRAGSAKQTASKLGSLTPRERDVLRGIVAGKTNKEIAAGLAIGTRTVESHRESLMQKLGVRHVAALTRLVMEEGIGDG